MKERPILFSGKMVRAILSGAKTQTRRIIKPQPSPDTNGWVGTKDVGFIPADDEGDPIKCPYEVGMRLWVRETFTFCTGAVPGDVVVYLADGTSYHILCENEGEGDPVEHGWKYYAPSLGLTEMKWKPSIFMPRWASRIQLEITGIRVEQLQKITTLDAIAEGIDSDGGDDEHRNRSSIENYSVLWELINGNGSWSANPWVWVIKFKRVKGVNQ